MDKCPICETKLNGKEPYYCTYCFLKSQYVFDKLGKESKFSFEPEMVHIKAGSFMMGSNDYINTKPIHEIIINYDFEIGKYPVTFEEYDYYCEEVGIDKPNDKGWSGKPVMEVSWNDAKAYTKWLSQKTGKNYRLLTEAEWEFVARAGTQTKWCFGDNRNSLKDYAHYIDNSNDKPSEVGLRKANQWGVYDMYGNVMEWCEDWYMVNYKKTPINGTAQGHNRGVFFKKLNRKVIRGGSYCHWADFSCSSNRDGLYPSARHDGIGFRIQRTLP